MKIQRDEKNELPAYAWPGGYPIYYLFEDSEICCPDCANGKNGSMASEDQDKQWKIVGSAVHWEGEALVCSHCYASIESAYGPVGS